jgi:hypothetical protein
MSALQFIHILPRALWILAHSWPWWRSCLIWSAIAAGVVLARREMREMRALGAIEPILTPEWIRRNQEEWLAAETGATDEGFRDSQIKEKYQNVEDSESTLER